MEQENKPLTIENIFPSAALENDKATKAGWNEPTLNSYPAIATKGHGGSARLWRLSDGKGHQEALMLTKVLTSTFQSGSEVEYWGGGDILLVLN